MAEYMAEIILEDVDRLIDNVLSLMWDCKEELKHLLHQLFKIIFVLPDAQKRQLSDESVRSWLMDLRDVANEGSDALDKFGYEKKLKLENQTMDQVRFSFCDSLDKIVNDIDVLGLTMKLRNPISKIRLENNIYAFQDNSEVVGRDFDVVKIVTLLTNSSNEQGISVLPIVGMGGLGKTTLANYVFNHELVKKHFDVLAWVHVGKTFSATGILREILTYLKGHLTGLKDDDVFQKIKELLWGKKYLLVLDDVSNVESEEWKVLSGYLSGISSLNGNKIIVTTRSDNAAKIMGTVSAHCLEKLSKDDCWSILKRRAFASGKFSLNFDLEAIGSEIARICRGVPLAARILGGIMCFKCDKSEWLSFQNDKIWDLLDDDNSDIFQLLKLSFDHLPTPSLKRCFSYCSVFPKDDEIKKEVVIHCWMAQGFITTFGTSTTGMDEIGEMYFNILLATSFFQTAREDACGNIISFKMHDLVHDLARFISKSETLIFEEDFEVDASCVRPLFLRSVGQMISRISLANVDFTKLRALVLENTIFESDYKSLRVLILHGIRKLTDSIGKLIHLRFLYIFQSAIMELPKSITELYNLQILRIENCGDLKLPKGLSSLINLRHFYTKDLIVRAPRVGQLTCLQTLPFFRVGRDEGCGIKELENLNQLSGELNIYNLDLVRDEKEARSANLTKKVKIFRFGFYWNRCRDRGNYENDEDVLEGLQPHPNLKSLIIESYKGRNFPSWMLTGRDAMDGSSLLFNLIEITLNDCSICKRVPTLGHLPCLKVLEMREMDKVSFIGTEFYSDGNYINKLFPALRRLEFQSMKNLRVWEDAEKLTTACEVFPCLEELTVENCSQLTSAPSHFPSLKILKISEDCRMVFEKISSNVTIVKIKDNGLVYSFLIFSYI